MHRICSAVSAEICAGSEHGVQMLNLSATRCNDGIDDVRKLGAMRTSTRASAAHSRRARGASPAAAVESAAHSAATSGDDPRAWQGQREPRDGSDGRCTNDFRRPTDVRARIPDLREGQPQLGILRPEPHDLGVATEAGRRCRVACQCYCCNTRSGCYHGEPKSFGRHAGHPVHVHCKLGPT